MTRIAYDTTNVPATVIPVTAQIVMGYVNGAYRSFDAVSQRCPNAVHVSIAVSAHGGSGPNGAVVADMLDIEAGDATPDEGEWWIAQMKAAGIGRPSIYCEKSVYGAVRNGTGRFILGVDYDLIIADWTGQPHACGLGEAGVQYIDHGPNGENYDLSYIIDDAWPHRTGVVVPVPTPAPPPPPPPPPPAPPVVAPPFPLPPGHWYGLPSRDPRNHSGYYGSDRPGIAAFQGKLAARGWRIGVDGIFGPGTHDVVVAFQREKGLPADALVGPATWATIWSAPVT